MINNREKLISQLISNDMIDINHLLEFFEISVNSLLTLVEEINREYTDVIKLKVFESNLSIVIQNIDKLSNTPRLGKPHRFNFIDYRIAYLIYRLIDSNEFLAIDDLAEEMMVSRSTINNDLKKAKKVLIRYNCRINGVPNKGISFEGSEFNIRLIYIYELYEKLNIDMIPTIEAREAIENINFYYNLNDFRKKLFYKTYMISVYRASKDFCLQDQIPLYKNFESESKTMQALFGKTKPLCTCSKREIEIGFMSFPINTRNSSFISDLENTYNVEVLRSLVDQMLVRVKKEFLIDINDEVFFAKVKGHLLFLINRLIFKLPNTEVFSQDLKFRFPLAFELARISLEALSSKFDLAVEEIDINYFSIYFAVVLNEKNKATKNDPETINNVAIISNRGRGFYEFISNQLKEFIGADVQVDYINTMFLKDTDLEKYNLIFTTEKFPEATNLPVINIKQLFPSQETMSEQINKVLSQKKIKVNDYENLLDIRFRDIDGLDSYEDNVKEIVSEIIEKGEASSDLLKTFLKRESESSMMYENGIAFPHLVDSDIDKMMLIVANARRNQNEELKTIYLLILKPNIDEKEEQVLTTLYNFIFSIIGDKNLLYNVNKIKDSDSLFKIIEEVTIDG